MFLRVMLSMIFVIDGVALGDDGHPVNVDPWSSHYWVSKLVDACGVNDYYT